MIQIRRPEDALHAFQTAWNSHDVESLGALFHEDAAFVNRFGHYVRGVAAIIELHAPIHATIYSDSTLENELIDVVAIHNDAAVKHFWSRLTAGAAHPAGQCALGILAYLENAEVGKPTERIGSTVARWYRESVMKRQAEVSEG
ncbi:SgcJ/EcaC family oxidoreductase [Paraburkholderia sp. LEh10]|uniref:YybH family protein n=1 Tax=Paraburkholderia sp. LEh10 TaxID=2821353 RepID=UPI001AE13059|nr:SgcJ/EcaC family oxidoreductase [Paraburkholderia sp. LEh10]MBP0590371.1 SgcJ/EcaC family oxidoreductase [Paraburkholderia sp. LEh10]